MELRVLSYFLTVAREENITKAAALLHVTQPTISRQLMQLEEELGVKLFRRSNHSICLLYTSLPPEKGKSPVDRCEAIGKSSFAGDNDL